MNQVQVLKLFPEAVLKYKVENYQKFNQELSKYIYELYESDNIGLKKSNKGGWHSQNFRLMEKDTIQNKFTLEMSKYIFNAFKNFGWKIENKKIQVTEMWAIINKKNDFNVLHTHPNCYLSAAYYVKTNKNCGNFEVECPNIAKRHSFPELDVKNELNLNIASIDISDGDLLLFPSYLPHKVGRNESDEDRIVISFNVNAR
tara:strand:- start:674 stop:1276 length:603 start_codon:yes stop_codon:yes gene_type:complete